MSDMPDSTATKQPGNRFKPGQSGNPAGRPRGARNRTTIAVEALMDGQAEALTNAAIEKALAGDVTALRLCLERIAPARKDAPITFAMPAVETAKDAMAASAAVLDAVATGEITPSEAGAVMALLAAHKTIVETADLERRIAELEQRK